MIYMTTREVAERCRRTPDTVLSWKRKGLLTPVEETPGGYLWHREDVEAFLRRKWHVAQPVPKSAIEEILKRRLG